MARLLVTMKLTLHIGMGKTGTSAIQTSLAASQTALHGHGVHYLGRWWGFVAPDLSGPEGIQLASQLRGTAATRLADDLVAHMEEIVRATSAEHFIFSNEALFAHTDSYGELYARLLERVDVQFVVFVRDPQAWLASAYAQWGIRHKSHRGAIKTFAEWATEGIGEYAGLRYWHETFGDRLVARKLARGQDAVTLFLEAAGLDFEIPSTRTNETPEPALLLLQALYNGGVEEPMFPARFLEDVYDQDELGGPPEIEALIERHLDGRPVADVVASRRELLDEVRDLIGIELASPGDDESAPPVANAVRARLLDYLMAITLRQARQISALERRLAELEPEPEPSGTE